MKQKLSRRKEDMALIDIVVCCGYIANVAIMDRSIKPCYVLSHLASSMGFIVMGFIVRLLRLCLKLAVWNAQISAY